MRGTGKQSEADGAPISSILAVGIVGTGYIADFQARAIADNGSTTLKAVCDTNLRNATTFAAKWNVASTFDSLESMLRGQKIDCIHLLTPPDQHFRLAKVALENDVSVFLEKPMCVSATESDELVELARSRKLYLGVNHNFSFSDAFERLRRILSSGLLGQIDHVIFNYFYELPQIRSGPFDIWMLREPGNVILETAPHLVSALFDLVGVPERPTVSADRPVTLPNGRQVFRRWRIRTTSGRTAVDININFGPGFPQRAILVRGLFGSAAVDFDANTCIVDRRTPLDPDLDRCKRSWQAARQLSSQSFQTLADYILGKLKLRKRGNPYDNSIRGSVSAFYDALHARSVLDNRIAGGRGRDVINYCVELIESAKLDPVTISPPQRAAVTTQPTVLVLGGTGFIGRELISQLLAAGYCVRAMVRGSSLALSNIDSNRLEVIAGDIRNKADLEGAISGIEFVYHLARAQEKTWEEYVKNEIEPTRLVAEICLRANVKRLVYTGTIDSYYAGAKAGTITETTPLDRDIERRNYYARAKAASETILTEMQQKQRLPLAIFRPGIVIGRHGNPFHWGVGRFSENICEVWGDGNNTLPFVLVEDVAAALVRGIEVPGIEGHSYNLIDAPLVTANDYLDELQRRAAMKLTVYHRPIWRFYLTDLGKWIVKVGVRHPDRVRIPSYRDWESRTQKAIFDCDRTRIELGWTPAASRQKLFDRGLGDALDSWLAATQ
jgi:nucleoside-diphosphate-sugar epimerase/predicted dehydrogenase